MISLVISFKLLAVRAYFNIVIYGNFYNFLPLSPSPFPHSNGERGANGLESPLSTSEAQWGGDLGEG